MNNNAVDVFENFVLCLQRISAGLKNHIFICFKDHFFSIGYINIAWRIIT